MRLFLSGVEEGHYVDLSTLRGCSRTGEAYDLAR